MHLSWFEVDGSARKVFLDASERECLSSRIDSSRAHLADIRLSIWRMAFAFICPDPDSLILSGV
jgi:hypothetical protein